MGDLLPAEDGLAWAGASVEQIRERWVEGDPFGPDCGEHRVAPGREAPILEALRFARADVRYLLAVIDRMVSEARSAA